MVDFNINTLLQRPDYHSSSNGDNFSFVVSNFKNICWIKACELRLRKSNEFDANDTQQTRQLILYSLSRPFIMVNFSSSTDDGKRKQNFRYRGMRPTYTSWWPQSSFEKDNRKHLNMDRRRWHINVRHPRNTITDRQQNHPIIGTTRPLVLSWV